MLGRTNFRSAARAIAGSAHWCSSVADAASQIQVDLPDGRQAWLEAPMTAQDILEAVATMFGIHFRTGTLKRCQSGDGADDRALVGKVSCAAGRYTCEPDETVQVPDRWLTLEEYQAVEDWLKAAVLASDSPQHAQSVGHFTSRPVAAPRSLSSMHDEDSAMSSKGSGSEEAAHGSQGLDDGAIYTLYQELDFIYEQRKQLNFKAGLGLTGRNMFSARRACGRRFHVHRLKALVDDSSSTTSGSSWAGNAW